MHGAWTLPSPSPSPQDDFLWTEPSCCLIRFPFLPRARSEVVRKPGSRPSPGSTSCGVGLWLSTSLCKCKNKGLEVQQYLASALSAFRNVNDVIICFHLFVLFLLTAPSFCDYNQICYVLMFLLREVQILTLVV